MASGPALQTRVLGGSEENWTKSTAHGTGIVAFGIALKRKVDIKLVHAAARELLERHALLRAQIVENAKGKLCFQLSSSAPVPVVEDRAWPSIDGLDPSGIIHFPRDEDKSLSLALNKIVQQELNIPFCNADGKTSPPLDMFRVHVYHHPHHAEMMIVLKMHSGAFDRHSSRVVAQEFLAALNALVEGRTPELPDASGREALMPCMEDLIPKEKASKGLLQKGIDTIGYAVNSKKYSLLPFSSDFTSARPSAFQSDIVSYSLGRHGTESLFAACKQENTTYAAALAAAFLKAAADLKELKEKKLDEFTFTNVLDCRSFLDPPVAEGVLGNYSSAVPLGEKVKEGVEFWDLARQISASTDKSLSKSKYFSEIAVLSMLFSQVLKHPGLTPSSSLRTALFTMFIDGPLEGGWKGVEALEVAGTLGPFSSMHFVGPCFCMGEAMVEGPELYISFVFPTPLFSKPQMKAFLNSALQLLSSSTLSSH